MLGKHEPGGRRNSDVWCFFGCALIALSLPAALRAADALPSRPNFVFIFADDWRWDCLGVVQRELGDGARFPWLQTPRLDRLAGQSIRFDQSFVVNSLCSPARACVFTGQYSRVHGIIGNSQPLPLGTVTFATRLQEAGYRTAYCGKWHMGTQQKRPGFSFVASYTGGGNYFNCPILLDGVKTPTHGWIDDVATDYAIKFLERQPTDQPFFLFLGFKSPHEPRGGKNLPDRFRGLYVGEQSRPIPNMGVRAVFDSAAAHQPDQADSDSRFERHRAYIRHITAIDECIGRLLDALDQSGLADRTIVIVTSDNGYYLGEHGLSDKRSAYEESIRVPLLIRLPGANASGTVNREHMVLNIDYGPTIVDLAGAAPLPKVDGRSLRPLLTGECPADWRTAFRYEYFKEPNYSSPAVLAVRTTSHKLITYPGHEEWTEAFDLSKDPFETENLAKDKALMGSLRRIQVALEGNALNHGTWWLRAFLLNLGIFGVLLWAAKRQRARRSVR